MQNTVNINALSPPLFDLRVQPKARTHTYRYTCYLAAQTKQSGVLLAVSKDQDNSSASRGSASCRVEGQRSLRTATATAPPFSHISLGGLGGSLDSLGRSHGISLILPVQEISIFCRNCLHRVTNNTTFQNNDSLKLIDF